MASQVPESGNTVQHEQEHRPWPWWGEEVRDLQSLTVRIHEAESTMDWKRILQDHLIWGNRKIAKTVAIYNLNAAHDCPNLATDNCQVAPDECYAVQSEKGFPYALDYRRRQEYLWDHMDAQTFVDAFRAIVAKKRNDVTALRFNQSGDVRHQGDVTKLEWIAEELATDGIPTYLYSASDYLDWSGVEYLTVNQSNDFDDYGDRYFTVLPGDLEPDDVEWLDDGAVQCPYDLHDGEIKCGECRLCIDKAGPDVYIRPH